MQLNISNLNYYYPFSEEKAISDVNLSFDEAGILGLLGPSGSGKSTLFYMLKGLLLPEAGQIKVNEASYLTKNSIDRAIQKEIGLVFQFPENQFFAETVFDEVAFALKQDNYSFQEIKERVEGTLNSLGLTAEDYLERSPFSLSGGEMRRIALASVLVSEPRLLLLDQPFTGLDSNGRKELIELLKRLSRKSIELIIIISHKTDLIAELCHKIIFMKEGGIEVFGEVKKLMADLDLLNKLDLRQPRLYQIFKCLENKGKEIDINQLNWEEVRSKIFKGRL